MRVALRLSALFLLVLLAHGCTREPAGPVSATTGAPPSAATETAPALPTAVPPAPGAIRTRPADDMEMVWIAPGRFLMGSDESPYPADRPEHRVELDAFWIDRLEVTNLQYKRCVEAGDCAESAALAGYIVGVDRKRAGQVSYTCSGLPSSTCSGVGTTSGATHPGVASIRGFRSTWSGGLAPLNP